MIRRKPMKLIIEIPGKYYGACKDAVEEPHPSWIEEIIANGIPYNLSGDLISREALKKSIEELFFVDEYTVKKTINNAPTVEPLERIGSICEENCGYRPQGKYVDISKLRLMTIEECAGHTIEYAMGWKACIEWLKKGGAE